MELEALAREYLTEDNEDNRRDIIANIYRECKKVLQGICAKYSDFMETEDLMQEGYFAIREALESYDPAKCTFKSYIRKMMHWHILRTLNQKGDAGGVLAEYRRIKRYEEEFMLNTGRKPTDRQTALHFHTYADHITEIKQKALNAKGVSLDAELADGITYADMIPDSQDIEADFCRKDLCERVQNAVRRLPAEERQIIEYRMRGFNLPQEREAYKEARKINERAMRHLESDRELRALAYEEGILARIFTWHNREISSTEWCAIRLSEMPYNERIEDNA